MKDVSNVELNFLEVPTIQSGLWTFGDT